MITSDSNITVGSNSTTNSGTNTTDDSSFTTIKIISSSTDIISKIRINKIMFLEKSWNLNHVSCFWPSLKSRKF